MAIIACPECKGQLSDQAPACPHCGGKTIPETSTGSMPQQGPHRSRRVISVVILLALMAMLAVVLIAPWRKETTDGMTWSEAIKEHGLEWTDLINETTKVKDDGFVIRTVDVKEETLLEMSLKVVGGGNVEFKFLDHENFNRWMDKKAYAGFASLSSEEGTNSKSHTGRIQAGKYHFIIKEASSSNILGSADEATVSIQIRVLTRSRK